MDTIEIPTEAEQRHLYYNAVDMARVNVEQFSVEQ
jgi:hypothetical protein